MPDNFKDENSGIDVDSIMEKIREEVNRRRSHPPKVSPQSKSADCRYNTAGDSAVMLDTSYLRTVISSAESQTDVGEEMTPEVSPQIKPANSCTNDALGCAARNEQSQVKEKVEKSLEATRLDTSYIRSIISSAESQADAGAEVTPMLEFKGLTRRLALFVGKKVVYLASFITHKQRNFNRRILNALRAITDGLEEARVEQTEINAGIEKSLETIRNEQVEAKARVEKSLEIFRSDQAGKQRNFNRAVVYALREITDGLERVRNEKAEVKGQVEKNTDALGNERKICEPGPGKHEMLVTEIDALKKGQKEFLKTISYLKSSVMMQERRLSLLLEEARKRLPEPISKEQLENMVKEEDHMLDTIFASFEDQLRGTREEIKERQRVYLSFIEHAKAGGQETPVLDLGCGRGEWLELLKKNGYLAKGIDRNRVMIGQCLQRGLDVVEAEVIEYLRKQKPNTFGAITGFHIIEHLPLSIMLALFDESLRVLKPGGLIIFETPNPENLVVGACNFYYDPRHKRPLPPDPVRFIAEQRGFVKTEILRLHKVGEPEYTGQDCVDEVIHRVNMEQDYSILGYKA